MKSIQLIYTKLFPKNKGKTGPTWSSIHHIEHVKISDGLELGTPLKINMEHNHGGLEDHVPF